jgi:phage I-like protein
MNRETIVQLHEGAENAYGYIVDLSTVELAESGTTGWIQAAPLGTWDHPVYGKLTFTEEKVQRFADNVKSNVRGQDLDIDYDHKAHTGEAAGWVRDAEARPGSGLWLLVDWTKDAFSKIKSGAYKYFSPEFVDSWENPKTGTKHQDVLFGGGITNRPFLKGILPMNLSELTGDDTHQQKEDGMDREFLELLARQYGVEFTEETSDTDLQGLITTAAEAEHEETEEVEEQEEEETVVDELTAEDAALAGVSLSELQASPGLVRLLNERKADQKRLAALEVAHRLSEVTIKLNDAGSKSKRQLSPSAKDALRKVAIRLDESGSDDLFKAVNLILSEAGTVDLSEKGGSENETRTGGDAAEKFEKGVHQLMETDKLGYADAVEAYAASEPELFEEYRSDSFAGREN